MPTIDVVKAAASECLVSGDDIGFVNAMMSADLPVPAGIYYAMQRYIHPQYKDRAEMLSDFAKFKAKRDIVLRALRVKDPSITQAEVISVLCDMLGERYAKALESTLNHDANYQISQEADVPRETFYDGFSAGSHANYEPTRWNFNAYINKVVSSVLELSSARASDDFLTSALSKIINKRLDLIEPELNETFVSVNSASVNAETYDDMFTGEYAPNGERLTIFASDASLSDTRDPYQYLDAEF